MARKRSASAPCLSCVVEWVAPDGDESEENAMRFDSDYAEWYFSQRPPDPRLPVPLITSTTARIAWKAQQGCPETCPFLHNSPTNSTSSHSSRNGEQRAAEGSAASISSSSEASVGPSRTSSISGFAAPTESHDMHMMPQQQQLPHHRSYPQPPPAPSNPQHGPAEIPAMPQSSAPCPSDFDYTNAAQTGAQHPTLPWRRSQVVPLENPDLPQVPLQSEPLPTQSEPGWVSRGPCRTCGCPVLVRQERVLSEDGQGYHHRQCFEANSELRTDPRSPHTRPYTKSEFVAVYGSTAEWDHAGKLVGEELRFDPASPGCRAYARWEFQQEYGGNEQWNQAFGGSSVYAFPRQPPPPPPPQNPEHAPVHPTTCEAPPHPQYAQNGPDRHVEQAQPPMSASTTWDNEHVIYPNAATVVVHRDPGELLGMALDEELRLRTVAPQGAAARAGLNSCIGLCLHSIDGCPVTRQADALAALGRGGDVTLQFFEDNGPSVGPPAPVPQPIAQPQIFTTTQQPEPVSQPAFSYTTPAPVVLMTSATLRPPPKPTPVIMVATGGSTASMAPPEPIPTQAQSRTVFIPAASWNVTRPVTLPS